MRGERAWRTIGHHSGPRAAERIAAACRRGVRADRRARQQRRHEPGAALEELTDEDWQSQWELNVLAPMRLMRACVAVDGGGRLGPDRQRLLVLGQTPRAAQRRLLGHQGRRAVALARVRGCICETRRADQRDHPGAGRRPSYGSAMAASPSSRRPLAAKPASMRSRRSRPVFRSAVSASRRRSRT